MSRNGFSIPASISRY